MNKAITAAVAALLVCGVAACGPTSQAPGRYKTTAKHVDQYGTEVKK
jgi:hypothetical protein